MSEQGTSSESSFRRLVELGLVGIEFGDLAGAKSDSLELSHLQGDGVSIRCAEFSGDACGLVFEVNKQTYARFLSDVRVPEQLVDRVVVVDRRGDEEPQVGVDTLDDHGPDDLDGGYDAC